MSPKGYSKEHKLNVVKAALASGEEVNVFARGVGLHPQTAHRWLKEYSEKGSAAWDEKATRRRGSYDVTFKREAVRRIVSSDTTMTAVARELGVSVALLAQWVEAAKTRGEAAFTSTRSRRNRSRKGKRARETAPRKQYPASFKREAVAAVTSTDRVIANVARDFGVAPQLLYEWVKADRAGKLDSERPKRPPRDYDADFRQRAVALALDPKNVPAQVARDLGISKGLLSQWVKRYGGRGNKAR